MVGAPRRATKRRAKRVAHHDRRCRFRCAGQRLAASSRRRPSGCAIRTFTPPHSLSLLRQSCRGFYRHSSLASSRLAFASINLAWTNASRGGQPSGHVASSCLHLSRLRRVACIAKRVAPMPAHTLMSMPLPAAARFAGPAAVTSVLSNFAMAPSSPKSAGRAVMLKAPENIWRRRRDIRPPASQVLS